MGSARFKRASESDHQDEISKLTLLLVGMAERIRGDNTLLSTVLKRQLLSTIDTIRMELSAPYVDVLAVNSKNGILRRVGEAIVKSVGNQLISELISNVTDQVGAFISRLFNS